jgi:trehalose synthase
MTLQEVPVQAVKPERLKSLIGPERGERFDKAARTARDALSGRVVWNVNSTRTGGGVAEMLRVLLAYARGVGIDTRWFVIHSDPHFFVITKRIHNYLSGDRGDGGGLGPDERAYYDNVLRPNVDDLLSMVKPRDIVLLHDPQVAGIAPHLAGVGAMVVWRCHIGRDTVNEYVERAWDFLYPYLTDVDAYVFSRRIFAPRWAEAQQVFVIPPSIDPFAPKNQAMGSDEVEAVLRHVGLIGGDGPPPRTEFARADGSRGRVSRYTDALQTGPPPPPNAPLVVQVSRWDRMKDMAGVMTSFAQHVSVGTSAHLVLAGPEVTGVADDPEGASVLADCLAVWHQLPRPQRDRVHLACVPMRDPDENFIVINALQRHADVVTQKSIAEGFGLTVAEAMWKSKPIVASAVGGIIDQVVSGEHGLLIDDPHDLDSFGRAVRRLLEDRQYAELLGANARRRAQTEFLGDRHLEQYAQLFARLDEVTPP